MKKHLIEHELPDIPPIEIGVYKHYRGKLYRVEGIGLHTESLEPMVVYRPLYDSKVTYWMRPYSLFTSTVIVDGNEVGRFVKVGE